MGIEDHWVEDESNCLLLARSKGLRLKVRSVSELLGGSLTVRSAPGRGTAFTLRLPRA